MPKYSITDCIFDNKLDKKLFNMKDEQLDELEFKMSEENDKMFKFINQRVHPKSRKGLKRLIENNDSLMCEYFYEKSKRYYNSGFSDGINLILSIIFK